MLPPSDASCGLLLSTPWIAHSARTSLMRTCRLVALLLDVLQERLYFVVFESEIGHPGVVVLCEEGFRDRVSLEHRGGITQPATQPTEIAALRDARQIRARAFALADR